MEEIDGVVGGMRQEKGVFGFGKVLGSNFRRVSLTSGPQLRFPCSGREHVKMRPARTRTDASHPDIVLIMH